MLSGPAYTALSLCEELKSRRGEAAFGVTGAVMLHVQHMRRLTGVLIGHRSCCGVPQLPRHKFASARENMLPIQPRWHGHLMRDSQDDICATSQRVVS